MYNYFLCLFILSSIILPFTSAFTFNSVVQINEAQLSLSWSEDPGASSYTVVDSQGNIFLTTRELSCILTVPNGQVYTFKVVSSLKNTSNVISKKSTQYIPSLPYNGTQDVTNNDTFVAYYPIITEIDSTTILVIFEEFVPLDGSCEYEIIGIINGTYKILAVVDYDLCTQVFVFSVPSISRTPSPTAGLPPKLPKRYQTIIKGIPSGEPISYKVRAGRRETASTIFNTSPVSNPNAYNYRQEYTAKRFTNDVNAPANQILNLITLSPKGDTKLYATFDIPSITPPANPTIQYGRIVLEQTNTFSEQQYFYYYNGGSTLKTYVNDASFSNVNYDYTDYQVQVRDDANSFFMPLKTKISGHLIEDTLQNWQQPGLPNNGFIIAMEPTSASSLNSLNLTSITLQTYNGEPMAMVVPINLPIFDYRHGECPYKFQDEVTGLFACTFPSGIAPGKNIFSVFATITGIFQGPLAATLGNGVIFQDYVYTDVSYGSGSNEYGSPDYNSNIGFWPNVEGNFTIYANDPAYLDNFSVTFILQEKKDLPSPTPSISMSPSPTVTPTTSFSTMSLSATVTPTTSLSPTKSISITPSISRSPTPNPSSSPTPSRTSTSSFTRSASRTPSTTMSTSITPTPSVSITGTSSNTPPPSLTPSTSVTSTPSISLSPSVSLTPPPSISITATSSPSRPVSPPPAPSQSIEPLGPTSSPSNTPSPSFGVILPTPSNTIQLPSATPSPLGFLNPCANGALVGCPVQPTEVVITQNQPTTFVLTSASGNTVGVVNVPKGSVPDGYSIRLTPVAVDPFEVIQNNIVSATIDLTAYSPDNEVTQISSDVEICLDVGEDVDVDKSCLGFFDESKNPPMWVCQDECLKSHQNKSNTFCGKTSHFTSFAILLTGSSAKCGGSSFDHIFDDSWKDYTLIGCTAAGIILILIFIACIINFAPSKVLYGEEGTRARQLRHKASSMLTASDPDAEEIV